MINSHKHPRRYTNYFGVMFHHFYDERHPKGQGAISAEDFEKLLNWTKKNFKIINADDFSNKLLQDRLKAQEVCITFDDALLCQYDIAAPILDSFGIKAFFNVYSAALQGTPDQLETYRFFRTTEFSSVDEFYDYFFDYIKELDEQLYSRGKNQFEIDTNFLSQFKIYSKKDKLFRFFRDNILESNYYSAIMSELMKRKNFDTLVVPAKVFMNQHHLKNLVKSGHVVGLHSHTHPTNMDRLSKRDQEVEYLKNLNYVSNELGVSTTSMAHPCGKYSKESIEVLKELGIRIGFAASLSGARFDRNFEIPREDHMNLMDFIR